MSTRSRQERRDSSSGPEVSVGLPTRPPVQPPDIRQPLRYPSNTTLANAPPGLNTSHRPRFKKLSVGGKVRSFKPAAQVSGFGPPNVPVLSVQGGRHPNSRRTTHFPLRNIPRRPSPKDLLEWQRKWAGRTSSGTRMNPEASAFAPKPPTYAQTVRASLPRRSLSEGQAKDDLTKLSGQQSESEASDNIPTDKPTKDILTAHRGSQTAEGRASAVVGSSSRDPIVARRHSSSIPRIEVTMESTRSQRELEASQDPLTHVSSKHRTTSTNMNAYDWYDAHHSPHPMSFHNPLLGPYIQAHSPMPGYEHLDPRYRYPSPWLAPPMPWDPAVASAWEHFHRSQSAQAYYGPFQPPPMPPLDMQQAYMAQQPIPPFAPFAGYPGQPLRDITDREAQTESLSPPPAPTKKIPSRGKLHQMVREAQRAKRHREHSQARAEAWRAQNENDRPPQPVFREREYSQTLPASSHAHPQTASRQGQPPSGFSPSREQDTLRPAVKSEQRGITQYRLISVKPTTPRPGRQKPIADNAREPSLESNDSALIFGEDKVDPRDMAHLASQTTGDTSKPATVKADGPPPNAPTGPASLRRFASLQQANLQHQRSSLIQKPAEQSQGSWSQSKRWVSQETKERAAFQKLMQTLRYMGADRSPFLPQTPSELTRFKIAQADRKSKQMNEQLTRMEERRHRRRKAQQEGLDESAPEILGGKKMSNNLSPVFAQESCFNKDLPSQELKVDWPCRAELKEEGDKRAARYGRYFPLPRLNIVATRILEGETDPYNEDGTISWEKKAVKHMSRFIRPVTSELEDVEEPVPIDIHELHQPLEDLLKEIDAFD